jgi:hypothetical protein
LEESIERQRVTKLMIEDYERVIFYLLKKLDMDLDLEEINVVIKDGYEEHEFKIKKPHEQAGVIQPFVHRIQFLSEI